MDLVLIRVMDIGFTKMCSYPHCGYTGSAGGSGFNWFVEHGFQLGVLNPHCKYR